MSNDCEKGAFQKNVYVYMTSIIGHNAQCNILSFFLFLSENEMKTINKRVQQKALLACGILRSNALNHSLSATTLILYLS